MSDPTNRLIMAFVRERSPREMVYGYVKVNAKHGISVDHLWHWCVSCVLDLHALVELYPGTDLYIDQIATKERCRACGNAMSVRSYVWTPTPP